MRYPSAETVFEYSVDVKNRQWLSWDSKLSGSFKPRPDIPAYRLLVPTVDTVRTTYLTNTLVRSQRHTLVVGGVGVGKTMTLQAMLEALPGNVWSSCTINLSAQTSSNSLQVGTAVMLWSAQAAKAACMQCTCAHKQLAVHSQNSTLQLHPTDIVVSFCFYRRTRSRASWRSVQRGCLCLQVASASSPSSTTSTCPRRASLASSLRWSCSSSGWTTASGELTGTHVYRPACFSQ